MNYLAMGYGTHYAGAAGGGTLTFYVADDNTIAFNPMPAGTVITAKGSTGVTVEVLGGSPVPSTGDPSPASVSYGFGTGITSGTVTVTFTTPNKVSTSIVQAVAAGAAPAPTCN